MGTDIEFHENETIFTVELQKNGGSHYLLFTPAMKEYIGLEEDKEGKVKVVIKADVSKKWGRFFGVGKAKG
jgi:hypothetical protein